MGKRFVVPAILLALLGVVQWQLWFGKGGVPAVQQLQQRLDEQQARNAEAKAANERLDAEVNDLKTGIEMVEERARLELGMVKPNEVFIQISK